MIDPTVALTAAIENSSKVANTPIFATVIDRLLGYKISEWKANGDVIKKQILDGYEDAKQKGLAIQYVSSFRASTNLINIGAKAAEFIDESKPNDISFENDFFWGLIEHSKEISSEEVQELIAKIIAGEYNKPGTYSMNTLQVIKTLGKSELELFERMCSLVINGGQIPQELFSLPDGAKPIMEKLKLDFGRLQELQSLGLFLPNDMTQTMDNEEKKRFALIYFDKQILFEPINPEDSNSLTIRFPGFYCLTSVGKQIIQHLKPVSNPDYFEWLKKNYHLPNYKITEQITPVTPIG